MKFIPNNTGKRIAKVNTLSQALLLKLLMGGTRTCTQLAEETGLHYITVLDYTRALHRMGVVHIASYEQDRLGRDQQKVFRLGEGKDAKRHKYTEAERTARYRAKRKAVEYQKQVVDAICTPLTPHYPIAA